MAGVFTSAVTSSWRQPALFLTSGSFSRVFSCSYMKSHRPTFSRSLLWSCTQTLCLFTCRTMQARALCADFQHLERSDAEWRGGKKTEQEKESDRLCLWALQLPTESSLMWSYIISTQPPLRGGWSKSQNWTAQIEAGCVDWIKVEMHQWGMSRLGYDTQMCWQWTFMMGKRQPWLPQYKFTTLFALYIISWHRQTADAGHSRQVTSKSLNTVLMLATLNNKTRHHGVPHVLELPGDGAAQCGEGCWGFLSCCGQRLWCLLIAETYRRCIKNMSLHARASHVSINTVSTRA